MKFPLPHTVLTSVLVLFAAFLSTPAQAGYVYFGTLTGGNVRPVPVNRQGTGTCRADLQETPTGDTLRITVTYSGLTGPALSAAVHGPAWINSTALPVFALTPTPGGFEGYFAFPAHYKTNFLRGLFYVQIKTAAYPDGEIRSQLPAINYYIPPEIPPNTIATAEFFGSGGGAVVADSLGISLTAYGADILGSFAPFTVADEGKTFIVSPLLGHSFNTFVRSLVDGVKGSILYGDYFSGGGSSSFGKPEYLFFHDFWSSNGFDLAGRQIDHIQVRLNKLMIASPGSDPNRNGRWTDYSYGASVFVIAWAPAPTIICPNPLTLECSNGSAIGTVTVAVQDPSGLPLTVVWEVNGVPCQTNSIPAQATLAASDLTFTGNFALGQHLVRVTASNGQIKTVTCSTTVTVQDTTPPTLSCPNDLIVAANVGCGAVGVSLGSPVFSENCGLATVTNDAPSVYSPGENLVTWTATDNSGNTSSCVQKVVVRDVTPPQILSLTATPNVLSPPNRRMVPVELNVQALDNCDPSPVVRITQITCNEPAATNDWQITGPLSLQLRAERSGKGNGRIYTIAVQCQDASGNVSSASIDVTVPRAGK